MSLLERLERLRQLEERRAEEKEVPLVEEAPSEEAESEEEQYFELKHMLFDIIFENVPSSVVDTGDEERVRREIDKVLMNFSEEYGIAISRTERTRLLTDFVNELLHFGPLEPLLEDPSVSRIVVNGPNDVYVERMGRLEKVPVRFRDEAHIIDIGKRMALALHSRLDENTPMMDRRLPDGSRVRIVIPPLARKGPTITIYKLARNPFEVHKEEEQLAREALEEPISALRERVIERVIAETDQDIAVTGNVERLRAHVETVMDGVLQDEGAVLSRSEREQLLREILNEITGLGPIQSLVEDPTITEIMVNGPYQVYVERNGKLELTDIRFRDNEHVLQIIEKIVAPLGRRIDESSPMVDARLKDGSRVNAIIPPLSLKGPCITIRKFSVDPLTVTDLINFGTLTQEVARFLEAAVQARLNIIVSGGTGSGKTTLLNVLSSFIPSGERIITIEDAAELQLRQEHVITLEARPPNVEGKGEVTIRDLVRNALRMRPDRIVVGECRGGEALDMLQAMNTGHEGSMTTAHANNPRELLARLETMVLMAGMDLPLRAIREQIAGALDLIVHIARFRDGSRKIQYITEVVGMEGEIITLQDLFVFEQEGFSDEGKILGRLRPTGIRPRCYDRIVQAGVRLPLEIFNTDLPRHTQTRVAR